MIEEIRLNYPHIKKLYKLSNRGLNNSGIYRLCCEPEENVLHNVILTNLRQLFEVIHNKRDELLYILGHQLEKETFTRGNLNQIKGLMNAGIEIQINNDMLVKMGRNRKNFEKWIGKENRKLADIIQFIEDKNKVPKGWVQEVDNVIDLAINPSFRIIFGDTNSWKKHADDLSCKNLLKIGPDKSKLEKERNFQLRAYQMGDPSNPITSEPGIVKTLKNIGENGTDLFSFIMKYNSGKEMCKGCPGGMIVNPKEDDNPLYKEQFAGFTSENTSDLLTKLKILYDNEIIHGDLNFQNLMVNGDGSITILDWGETKDIKNLSKNTQKTEISKELNLLNSNVENLLSTVDRYAPRGVVKIQQTKALTNLKNGINLLNQQMGIGDITSPQQETKSRGGKKTRRRRKKKSKKSKKKFFTRKK